MIGENAGDNTGAAPVRSRAAAFVSTAIIGTLGGLIGLGGAEFRLPLLISLFRFRGLEAVILNKVDMPLGPSGIERLLATLSHERRCHERLRRIAYAIRTSEHIMPAMNGELLKRVARLKASGDGPAFLKSGGPATQKNPPAGVK